MSDEYRPSRRSSAPLSDFESVSYSARMSALYFAEYRLGGRVRSGTSGSGSVVSCMAPDCARGPAEWWIVVVIGELPPGPLSSMIWQLEVPHWRLTQRDGRDIVSGGGRFASEPQPGDPAIVTCGRISPQVVELSLVQDGEEEERRTVTAHFGAWVICTDNWSPFTLRALHRDGSVVGMVKGPPELPKHRPKT